MEHTMQPARDLYWDGRHWIDANGQRVKVGADPHSALTTKRILISVLLTPLALVAGLVVYFVGGLLLVSVHVDQGVMTAWLLASVGATVLGAWALVWALVKS